MIRVSKGAGTLLGLPERIDGCRESDDSMLAGLGGQYPDR